MIIYNLADLDALIQNIRIQLILDYTWAVDAIDLLTATGMRPNEIFGVNRFSSFNSEYYQLATSKKNLPRLFPKTIFKPYMQELIADNQAPLTPYSERRLRMLWDRTDPNPEMYVLDKPIELYVMRHTYIKTLAANGYTLEEIALDMGYTSTTVVSGYINSVIYSI